MRVLLGTSFPFEHPDGGTFYVRPAEAQKAATQFQSLTRQEFFTDGKGEIVFRPDGQPVTRFRRDIDESIQYAINHVERFEGIVNAETGEPLASTPENIALLCRKYIGTTTTEIDAEEEVDFGDGIKGLRQGKKSIEVPEPLYEWVLKRVQDATRQLRELQRKNS